jgi:hypothetical protein
MRVCVCVWARTVEIFTWMRYTADLQWEFVNSLMEDPPKKWFVDGSVSGMKELFICKNPPGCPCLVLLSENIAWILVSVNHSSGKSACLADMYGAPCTLTWTLTSIEIQVMLQLSGHDIEVCLQFWYQFLELMADDRDILDCYDINNNQNYFCIVWIMAHYISILCRGRSLPFFCFFQACLIGWTRRSSKSQ